MTAADIKKVLINLQEPVVRPGSEVTSLTAVEAMDKLKTTGIVSDSYSLRPSEVVTIPKEPEYRMVSTIINDRPTEYVIFSVVSQLDGKTSPRWISLGGLYRNYWDETEKAYVRFDTELVQSLTACRDNKARFEVVVGQEITCDFIHRVRTTNELTGVKSITSVPVCRFTSETEVVKPKA